MRFHKPIGIVLLWSPISWALWIANNGMPPLYLIFLFSLGTFIMRAAGCVVNDIIDRDIDWQVSRTQYRPLTTGVLTLKDSLILLSLLLLSAFIILVQLPITCFYYGFIALLIVFIYPFCKRFMKSPQLVLGIAFSMSIPMVFIASNVAFNEAAMYLLLINFCWVIAYDTQYAMADREDDLRIGVKSTAVLFAHYDKTIIACLQVFLHLLWLPLAMNLKFSTLFWLLWIGAALILIYQQKLIINRHPRQCLQAFLNNSWYGTAMWLAIIVAT